MRIVINCRSFLNRNYTGIGRYTSQLVRSLIELDSYNEYFLYVKKGLFDFKRRPPKVRSSNFYVKVDSFGFGVERTVGPYEIYHSPSLDHLNVRSPRIVVTVHDLIFKAFPQGHTEDTIRLSEKFLKETVHKATRVICCSRSTAEDLQRFYRIEKHRIAMVYQGVDRNMFYPIREADLAAVRKDFLSRRGVRGPFILFVGTLEPRKNLVNLLHAYAQLKHAKKFNGPLVVIGMKGWKNEKMLATVKELRLEKDVIFQGFVTNEELRLFYNLAEAFVFPSYYEGFGFPILEAMSCGTPVITSNTSSCPEVAGDAAVLIDPHSPDALAQALTKVLGHIEIRRQLREKGLQRAQQFSWHSTAQQTLKVYQEACP